MLPPSPVLPSVRSQLTQHALLVIWGHFAQSLPLLATFAQIPIAQKTVRHTPQTKLVTLLLGLLSGIEHLSDLSTGVAPLMHDPAVATAWGLPGLVDASAVSRTLAACDAQTLHAVEAAVTIISQPFWQAAVHDLLTRQQPFLFDVDLTGRPVSARSIAYADAAFGYMDGAIRRGYQVAEICLQTPRYGRQWLSGQQHPGDTVSAPCLLQLIAAAEARLGCHPRRRTELVDARISTHEQMLATWQEQQRTAQIQLRQLAARTEPLRAALQAAQRRVSRLTAYPMSAEQGGPYGGLTQAERHLRGVQRQWHRLKLSQQQALDRDRRASTEIGTLQAELTRLRERRTQLAAENANQWNAPVCWLRMDAGFSSGDNLTAVLELGYDVETKIRNPAVVAALQQRVTAESEWTRVGLNAEMIAWCEYYIHRCPYPVQVALERFQTAQGYKYSVLLRNQTEPASAPPDVQAWFAAYNGRQVIEAGICQSKSVFQLQRLWSRSAVGSQIQVALTLFAANFVRWAEEWLTEQLWVEAPGNLPALTRTKYLVRVAANSLATVEEQAGQVVVRFSSLSSLAGVVVHVAGPPGLQLPLPLCSAAHICSR